MSTMNPNSVLSAIKAHKGKFFRVAFVRKTKGKNGEKPGDIREMLCRRHVKRHVKGVLAPGERAEEDARCGVLSVWDVEVFWREYHSARKEMGHVDAVRKAGGKAFRRIAIDGVVSLSCLSRADVDKMNGAAVAA